MARYTQKESLKFDSAIYRHRQLGTECAIIILTEPAKDFPQKLTAS